MQSPAHRSSHICSSGIWSVATVCLCLKVFNFCAFLVQGFGVSHPHPWQGIVEVLLEVRLILDFFYFKGAYFNFWKTLNWLEGTV